MRIDGRKFVLRGLAVLLAALALGMLAPAAYAQGCVMCYTSAAAGGPKAQHTFNLAILTLLIPPLAMFIGVVAFAMRRRNAPPEEPAGPSSPLPPPKTAEPLFDSSWRLSPR